MSATTTALGLTETAARAAADKKAEDVIALDVSERGGYARYNSELVSHLINHVMRWGKKAVSISWRKA